MRKCFNVTGRCYPEQHYMVDISSRLCQIKKMVDQGDYFCINRGRQYGKTTTLSLLKKELEKQYAVFFISLEGIGEAPFESGETLAYTLLCLLYDTLEYNEVKHASQTMKKLIEEALASGTKTLPVLKLSRLISEICAVAEKPVILLVDEVDQAGSYAAFFEFLGLLRDKYLKRKERLTFQSVILAGVYNIKNLKLKIRPQEEHQYNSPWNTREGNEPGGSLITSGDCPRNQMVVCPFDIAADFDVNMDFTKKDIEGMLASYEEDCQTGMDLFAMADLLYDYTSGYPFLVSRLCKIIDEKLAKRTDGLEQKAVWNKSGFLEAVNLLLSEPSTLFDDMYKKLSDFPEMRKILYEVLYEGHSFPFNIYDSSWNIAVMFGYIKNSDEKVAVANRIFEIWLYNLFASEERLQSDIYTEGSKDRNFFIHHGKLDMKRVLERFVVHFSDLYGNSGEKFIEKSGRKYFLFYLKPIINGTGNYYVEAQTRDEGRTDVVVDYLGEQYIVELKIWHGNAYHERGEQQLLEYLDTYHLNKGYMLSFNFNQNKKVGVKEIRIKNKLLIEAVV